MYFLISGLFLRHDIRLHLEWGYVQVLQGQNGQTLEGQEVETEQMCSVKGVA